MRVISQPLLAGLLIAGVLACGTGATARRIETLVARGAYAEAVAFARAERRAQELAERVLEREARSSDPRRRNAAFGELQLAGTRAEDVLERLAEAGPAVSQARALAALMQLGHGSARARLRGYAAAPDPELSALGHSALDPVEDRAQLLRSLEWPQAARRLAAVQVLERGPADASLVRAFSATLRSDPSSSVRAAAASALGGQGDAARLPLEQALSDAEEPVRLAAIAALSRVGAERERARLARDLGNPPSAETLAAAAALLRVADGPDGPRARNVFERALESGDPALRGRAAVLCRGLPEPGCDPSVLRTRLAAEPRPELRLLVALAIGPRDPAARAALRLLARQAGSPTAVEAAAELIALGDDSARGTLDRALQAPDPRLKVSALRAIARERGRAPAELLPYLADADPSVRTTAAYALLMEG